MATMTTQRPFLSPTKIWALGLLSLISIIFSITYQDRIFPSITTPITMSQAEAINKAVQLNQKSPLGLPKSASHAASYVTDQDVNNYLSLEDPTNQLLNDTLDSNLTQTSYWSVRLFQPKEIRENYFMFAPDGSAYGFEFRLSEEYQAPSLSKQAATKLAQSTLLNYKIKGINTKNYTLRDHSEEKVNSRIDHLFVYENTKEKLADAHLQIKITVSGNVVSALVPTVKLPETFLKEYENTRSFNATLGAIGNVIIVIGYGALLITGAYHGAKSKKLDWRSCTTISLLISFFYMLNTINFLPAFWYSAYKTTQSFGVFVAQIIFGSMGSAIVNFIQVLIPLTVGEYLTRKAYPNLPQLWNWWHTESAASKQTAYYIKLGYIIFGCSIGFQAMFYLMSQKIPGVWIPTGPLFDPNFITAYLPALTPFSISFQAGIWEELLFRAVPIASAVLIGRHYKREKLALAIIIPLQAIIFGLAHASYPQQPFYIRTIELGIPFTIYGLIYLRNGLLPLITAHFLFDVFATSTILFSMNTPQIWIQQTLALIILAAPALVVLKARVKKASWSGTQLPERYLNKNWKNPSQATDDQVSQYHQTPQLSHHMIYTVYTMGIIAVCVLGSIWLSSPQLTQPLSIYKKDAIRKAIQIAEQQQMNLDKPWTITTNISLKEHENTVKYLIDSIGKEATTKLLQKPNYHINDQEIDLTPYLPKYTWDTRFALFEGTQDDKAEILTVSTSNQTTLFEHTKSENIKAPSLEGEQAATLAQKAVNEMTGTNQKFDIIKKIAHTTPANRTDWQITFELANMNDADPVKPRIDILITGNQITGQKQYLHIPEKWINQQTINAQELLTIAGIESIIKTIISLVILALVANHFVKQRPNFIILRNIFLTLLALQTISFINSYEFFEILFEPSISYTNQLILIVAGLLLRYVFTNTFICLCIHDVVTKQMLIIKRQGIFQQIAIGTCTGLIILAIRDAVASMIAPETNWKYGGILFAYGYTTWLNAIALFPIDYYLIQLLICLVITVYAITNKNNSAKSLAAIIIISTMYNSLANTLFVTTPFIVAIIWTTSVASITLAWFLIIRKLPLTLPSIIATSTISTLIFALTTPATPVIIGNTLLAILVITGLNIGITMLLEHHQISKKPT